MQLLCNSDQHNHTNSAVRSAAGFTEMALTKVLIVSLCVLYVAVKWTSPTFDPETLRGARVLVTGASTGIGEQMAYHYARFGAQIVITARREKVLQQVVEECLRLGAQKAVSIAADMSTDSDPDRVVDSALETLGGLDFLVLNHIGSIDLKMWDGDHKEVQQLMKVSERLGGRGGRGAVLMLCLCEDQLPQLRPDGWESSALPGADQRSFGGRLFFMR
ncbi:Hydroxysteroid 11-beta-dehydrogenase 1-like protein [Oryzias melastigma]|uniref:Hydroxysteroid 11-beta-dehydrogenase 1-like protein n=1 Tax=Oryzias melastigma TaxID=30732 RepID=A0A834BW38_ORYME|nr:Hydroxysteroid 11-beta-dehydrogenase 1-like protein [Oryzias melastigma]